MRRAKRAGRCRGLGVRTSEVPRLFSNKIASWFVISPRAPAMPEIAVGCFDLAGKSPLVAERRSLKTVAHAGAQRAQSRDVAREAGRDGDKIAGIIGNQVRHADLVQQAPADAGGL